MAKISRENNFDLIRLFAASQVLIGHGLSHLECGSKGHLLALFPGVIMFFVISGFLISSSFDRNPKLKNYIRNRFLRIFPALWCCFFVTLICLLVFGYVNKASLTSTSFWAWAAGQISIGQFYTPDFLRSYGVGTPNGSLWTIPVELSFYILLPLIVFLFKKINLKIRLAAWGGLSIIANVALHIWGTQYAGLTHTTAATFAGNGGGYFIDI